jgi:hypothetical protein
MLIGWRLHKKDFKPLKIIVLEIPGLERQGLC